MPRKWILLFICIFLAVCETALFAVPTSDFALNSKLSNLFENEGILYTRSGSLALSGIVSPNVSVLEFSGNTLTGAPVYFSGNTLSAMNARFASPTSLTDGSYVISAFDGSGVILGSDQLIVDKIPPKAQKISYFDLDHNGKIDELTMDFDEPIFGIPALPYSTGMTVYTRKGGLVASGVTSNLDFSDHIIRASLDGKTLTLGLREGDMIKNNLAINTSPGSSNYSDLKVGVFAQANISDFAGNTMNSISNIVSTSKFPNSSTGIFNSTTGIDFIDTGYLSGSNFSGSLTIQKIDSRNKIGGLFLNGIMLTVTADSFLGDGNILQIGSGSKIIGNNTTLSVGSESHVLLATGGILFGKEGFSSAFRTLSGENLSSVSAVSESGILYTYSGVLIGSGLTLTVDYVSDSGTVSLFSGGLSGNSMLIGLPHELSGGNLRAVVSRSFPVGEDSSFSGITLIFDVLTKSSVSFAASIASTGSISDITKHEAKLSGVIFRPNIPGNIYYGTGELSRTGTVNTGVFSFSGLTAGTLYSYRLGLVSFLGWDEIFSPVFSFTTLPAAIPPPPVSIAFQSTTYLTNQNPVLNEFTCDTTHADCKINFNLESSFSVGYKTSDYFCELNFDLDYESGEEYKCNPNTVTFPRGHDYVLHFRIIHTPEVSLFTERTILIHSPILASTGSTSTGSLSSSGVTSTGTLSNSGTLGDLPLSASGTTSTGSLFGTGIVSTGSLLQPIVPIAPFTISGGGSTSTSSSSISPLISILDPVIIVQSGLDADNHCMKSDCTLNFDYKVLGNKEACHWDFPGGSYLSGTENKCNPGYVHYPFGDFTVTLRVFEQGNISNFREKVLHFTNGTPAEVYEAKINPINHPPVATIQLQGTLGKSKKQSGNSVTCIGVDECSVNLSASESYDLDRDKLTYSWNFGNGVTSDKENPLAIRYVTGEYLVVLRVADDKGFSGETTFHISVLGKNQKEIIPVKFMDPNVLSLRITGASPNPLGNDGVSEWVEISNPLGQNVSLMGCTLDDVMEKGSSPYIFTDTALIHANSSNRFYKLQTSLNFNNTGDSVNLSCGGKLTSTLSWDYSVPEGFVVSGKEGPYSGRVRTKVLRVVDGDTIVIELYGKQEKVRLIGVDTPETVDPRKVVQYYGKEASNYTRSQLDGHEVELEFDFNPRDKYDRLLAYVWLDNRNFDAELIRLGYARAYLRFPFRYFKEFEKLGKEAEKNMVGIWADLGLKKILNSDAKEDKKALDEQLKDEDKAILDDLVEVTKETKIGSEKIDAEILDRLLSLDNEEEDLDTLTYIKKSKISEGKDMDMEDIKISLQGALSKNRILRGNIFTCHTKTTCSVNFTAGKSQKDTIYFWDFGNGQTFYGANPVSEKFLPGKHTVTLEVFNLDTLSIREEVFQVVVEKLVSTKKVKIPKIVPVKKEKPIVAKGQNFFIPPQSFIPGITNIQASVFGGIIACIFFGGIYGIVRRKRLFLDLSDV